MDRLDAIFSPQSVAVVGASKTPGKVGHDIFANILRGNYTGTLYPVNPSAKSVLSVKAYPNILDIPDQVELAIIILPPKIALEAVHQAVEKKIKGIVIVSAGFREVGKEGLQVENQIVSICKEAGIRLVGPNCLGVINPNPLVSLNASFSTHMPKPGNISFISQSGALCTAVLDFAADRDFGFSKFISIGNKADVDELDILRYLHQDLDTEVIMLYLEELRRGPEFIEEVKHITSGNRPTPILAIKSGRTSAGAMAAASHTGAIAGTEAVYDAIFTQSGIIRADSIDDLFNFANAFTFKKQTALGKIHRKIPSGNRVAIITNAGGPGIVATDMTVSSGLKLASFSNDTIRSLANHLPQTANLKNPVDVIGDASFERYESALEAVIKDEGVDGALVILTPQSMTDTLGTAEAIVRIINRTTKPVLCCFMGIFDVSAGVKYLQERGVPVYRFPEDAAKAFGALFNYSQWLNRDKLPPFTLKHDTRKANDIIQRCLKDEKYYLGELDGLDILKCYGFSVLPTYLAKDQKEAQDIAAKIGYPVVLKIVSPQIIHKSDAGGVVAGIDNKEEIKHAFSEIVANAKQFNPKAQIDGVLVQKMAESGQEAILGMNRYPVFGPLLMFGFGGIFVEVFQDVSFRLAPIGRTSARKMIRSIKGYKMFQGFRGKPRRDVEHLEKLLISLSDMVTQHPEIIEMDINPLFVHEEGRGATVADLRIILKKDET